MVKFDGDRGTADVLAGMAKNCLDEVRSVQYTLYIMAREVWRGPAPGLMDAMARRRGCA